MSNVCRAMEGAVRDPRRRRGGWVAVRAAARLFVLVLLLTVTAGCNNSRYGVNHDQRLAQLRRVGVIVPSVKVFSLHTGGVQEERPDMEPVLQEATVAALLEEVSRCQREPVPLAVPAPSPENRDNPVVSGAALLGAITEGIVTHHYLFGKERTIDYISGDAPRGLGRGDIDALLYASVHGVVPTAGREGLKATAMVVGLITGIHIRVPTKQAMVSLLLLDCKTGEVLWFNLAIKEIKIDHQKDFRKLCKEACAYLLKPSK